MFKNYKMIRKRYDPNQNRHCTIKIYQEILLMAPPSTRTHLYLNIFPKNDDDEFDNYDH